MKKLFLGAIIASLLTVTVTLTGCQTSIATRPVTTHVVQVVGTGKKLGIVEDPVTGMYSAGYQSIMVAITTVPVETAQDTNGMIKFITPDAVASYEINGQSGLFGKAGSTYTVAVGPKAVDTLLGGMHLPVNENIVTGEVVQAQSPSAITAPPAAVTPSAIKPSTVPITPPGAN